MKNCERVRNVNTRVTRGINKILKFPRDAPGSYKCNTVILDAFEIIGRINSSAPCVTVTQAGNTKFRLGDGKGERRLYDTKQEKMLD